MVRSRDREDRERGSGGCGMVVDRVEDVMVGVMVGIGVDNEVWDIKE